MRAAAFLLLVSFIGLGCGDDSDGDGERDGSTEEHGDGGDGGDADGHPSGPPPSTAGDGGGDGGADGGNDGGGDDEHIVSAMIGSEGGTLTSSDGKLTLSIPEGALRDDELISIELLPRGESQALLADADELVSYRFEPDGLELDAPVEVAVELADLITPAGEEAVVPLVFASVYSDSENTLAFLGRHELAIDLDSGAGRFTTEIEHFSSYSFETWQPNNELTTPYFYFEVSPLPPAEMELGKDYGVGLHFYTRHFLDEALPLTYRDFSEGLVYSGGSGPIDIGSIPGEADQPTQFVIDAGDYACSELGRAQYEARLISDVFTPPPVPSDTCESATDKVKCVVGDRPTSVSYNVRLTRAVDCIAEHTQDPGPDGAPFSGFVRHRRSLGGASGRELSGAFYDGGADQGAFDAYVAAQRRQLGIMADRGADGTCRAVDLELYNPYLDNLGIDIDFSHVGAGADDAIALDFLVPPSNPLWTAAYQQLTGMYALTFAHNEAFTEQGLAVHVPASAAEPTIVLPGWDENIGFPPKMAPSYALRALEGVDITISWQADEVGGELIHIWAVGGDVTSDPAAFECFASVQDQLLTIPAAIITGVFPATPTDPLYLDLYFEAGSHTTAEHNGKTLDGYNIFRYVFREETDDPNNPDG